METRILGIDVGGTKVAAGLIAWPEGRAVVNRIIPTRAQRGGRAVLDDVIGLTRALADEARSSGDQLAAIGIGICEIVDREGRIASANCVRWLNEPAVQEFSAIAPTVIEADVRAAALAESLFGAGKTFHNFLYVTVGTGISCCLMIDGEPYLGAHGATGTMASSPLNLSCEKCDHASRRSLEEISSGPALAERFYRARGIKQPGHAIAGFAAAGDTGAREVIASAAEALGSQLGVLVSTLDPEAVIVGGGLGLSEGLYWEHLVSATRHSIWWDGHRDLPILRAATGENAGWIGAAAKAGQHFQKQLNLTKS